MILAMRLTSTVVLPEPCARQNQQRALGGKDRLPLHGIEPRKPNKYWSRRADIQVMSAMEFTFRLISFKVRRGSHPILYRRLREALPPCLLWRRWKTTAYGRPISGREVLSPTRCPASPEGPTFSRYRIFAGKYRGRACQPLRALR